MSRNLEISLQKENFILSAGRALYWPAQKALIIADLHLGKTAHFRAHGLAIPATVLMEDLNRLAELIAEFQPIHEDTSKERKGYTMSGHLHPGVILKGKGRQALKLPCFVVGKHQLILPAFSIFTGLYTAYCIDGCDFYAIAEGSLFKMKG